MTATMWLKPFFAWKVSAQYSSFLTQASPNFLEGKRRHDIRTKYIFNKQKECVVGIAQTPAHAARTIRPPGWRKPKPAVWTTKALQYDLYKFQRKMKCEIDSIFTETDDRIYFSHLWEWVWQFDFTIFFTLIGWIDCTMLHSIWLYRAETISILWMNKKCIFF